MKQPKKPKQPSVDAASIGDVGLLSPPNLCHFDAEERLEYLRRLFHLDIRLITFVTIARNLGFGVTSRWDHEAFMPEFVWLH
ncbi:hypothetical protein C9I57_17960 [Trinickia symbiotica]|uniref:Uncharacterized protein n=1 Tax=Trinickia symbiotica TaxID=863227 RepID=A0A2T3XSU7_9BURK|nr:hypothetical protein [Trinickia symbiotica]PTB19565.1 hypothetical protein C9I57_17960 [Trinickia symbiotica]